MKVTIYLLFIALSVVALNAKAEKSNLNGQGIIFHAEEDIKNNDFKYFLVGMPMAHDEEFNIILRENYNVSLIGLGCTPGSEEAIDAEKYNKIVVVALEKKYGKNFLAKVESEAKKAYENKKKP